MFSVLLEATTAGDEGRKPGDRHSIIAIVDGQQADFLPRATAELSARGWTNIEVKKVGPVMRSEASETPSYISSALSDAEETGFGFVVYIKPLKAT